MNTVVVTGAAQGVGLATASLLARSARVILLDLQPMDAQVIRLRAAGAEVACLSGDISSEAFVQQAAQWLHGEYGPIDGLVNNAGISLIARAEETSAAQWQRVMDINLFGPFLLCKYLGAQMLARGRGSIVNVASVAGLAAVSHRSAYNASKHGLIGLTKTLASEWGGRGVRVNAVCPGWIKTAMDVADQGSGAYSDQDIIDRVPMARFAHADDVAEAIAFLLDHERGGFINGVSLPVDGGWTADASWESLRVLGFFLSGIFSGMGAFLAELYPNAVRGSGQGFCYNFGRAVGAVCPALIGAWSTHGSLALALAISGTTVAAYALVIAAAWALPETCGRALVADPA